jgi:coenzyme F420-reducing hydrogenase alpha subunit
MNTVRNKKMSPARRYKICEDCEHLSRAFKVCARCSCFMIVKVTLNSGKCPIGKW